MTRRIRTVVLVLAAWTCLAAVACSKKDEGTGKGKPVDAPTLDASASPTQDAAPASPEATAPADATLPADAAGAVEASAAVPPPPPGAGAAMLAQLLGSGLTQPSAAPSEPGADTSVLLRRAGKSVLDQEEVPALERATDAARIASGLSAPASPSAAVVAGPAVPTPPGDPCDRLMPRVAECLATELGEALSAEELQEATRECSTTYAGMPATGQDALRQCAVAVDCGSLLRCLSLLNQGGEAGTGGAAPPPPPPGQGTFCARLVQRMGQCSGVQLPAPDEAAAVEQCTATYGTAGPTVQRQAEACIQQPCDSFFACLGEANPARTSPPTSTGSELDPARVAALPPATRAECTDFADGFLRCYPALAGIDPSQPQDPAVEAAVRSAMEMVKPELEKACLQVALDSPEAMPLFRRLMACTRGPCDKLLDCFQTAAASGL